MRRLGLTLLLAALAAVVCVVLVAVLCPHLFPGPDVSGTEEEYRRKELTQLLRVLAHDPSALSAVRRMEADGADLNRAVAFVAIERGRLGSTAFSGTEPFVAPNEDGKPRFQNIHGAPYKLDWAAAPNGIVLLHGEAAAE